MRFERFEPGKAEMLEAVSTTLGDVRVGDVMRKGTVTAVDAPRPARSGRMLMTITYDSGEQWIVQPDTPTNLQRPTE